MRNKIFITIMPLLFIALLSAGAEEKIKIGLSTALTGDGATWGTDLKNALLFANQELARNRYEIVIEDDRCAARDAAAVAQKLVAGNVRYVFGNCSATVLAAAPVYEAAGVVLFAPIATSPAIPGRFHNIFRSAPSDAGSAKMLFDYISARHKKVGILTEESDYSEGIRRAFEAYNNSGKLRIFAEGTAIGERDARPALLKFKQQGIEALFINSNSEATFVSVLRQVHEMKLDWPIYADLFPGSSTFRKLVSEKESDGIVFADFPSLDSALVGPGKDMVRKFEAQYGKMNSWDITLPTTIEAFRALDEAIRSGEGVRKYILTHDFSGIFGKYHFDEHGEIVGFHHVLKKFEGNVVREIRE